MPASNVSTFFLEYINYLCKSSNFWSRMGHPEPGAGASEMPPCHEGFSAPAAKHRLIVLTRLTHSIRPIRPIRPGDRARRLRERLPRRAAVVPLALWLLAAVLAALPGVTATLDPAQVKETVFPSGLRLLVKEARATDLVSVQVWIQAGGFLEDERSCGVAHTIEHLIFRSSGTRGPAAVDSEIENLGGLLEASTEKDWTRFACTVNGRYVAKVLNVTAEALLKPQFRQEDLDAERPLVMEEISGVALDPQANLARALHHLAFKKHPYGLDVRGIPRVVDQLKIEEVEAFYRKHYLPSRMTVVVVGDVDPAGVERVVRAAFAADRPGPKPAPLALPPPERACEKPERLVLPTDFRAGYVGIAFPAPSVTDLPDVHAMDVLLTIMDNGDSGRLHRLMKDIGVVKATYETRRQPGLFSVIAAAPRMEPEQVEALLRKEVEQLRVHPVPEAELALAKRALRGAYALDNETYSGQAATLGYYAAIDRWQFACEYLEKVEAVTAEQVQEVARKYLHPDHTVAVLLKPRNPGAPARPASNVLR
jgi:zinc protease